MLFFWGYISMIFTLDSSISASRTGVRDKFISAANSFSLIWLPGSSFKVMILSRIVRRA